MENLNTGHVKKKLQYLFDRYYNGLASEDEKNELFYLINELDHAIIDDVIAESWQTLTDDKKIISERKSKETLEFILQQKVVELRPKKFLMMKWIAATAAILALALFLWQSYSNKQTDTIKNEKSVAKNNPVDIDPGKNKAYLTLSDNTKILLVNEKDGLVATDGNAKVLANGEGQISYQTNATAPQQLIPTYNTLTTPSGGQQLLVLADGTKVWLNAESSLKFPTVFNGAQREVELNGEAYFEVAKNALKPFRVKVNGTSVKVLGTHFNIMAYQNEMVHKTTLLEGSIEITNAEKAYRINPGEQVKEVNNHLKKPEKVDAAQEIAWKNGFFEFQKTDLEYIMRQVARWYNVDVVYTKNPTNQLYTGRISRNVKISALLNILKYTGLDYRIEGKKIIITEQ